MIRRTTSNKKDALYIAKVIECEVKKLPEITKIDIKTAIK